MIFKPIKLMDIELSEPLKDIENIDGYESIQALVRLHGTPIGYVTVPLINGRCSATILNEIIQKKHNQTIIRRLLHNELIVSSQPLESHISCAFDKTHSTYNGHLPSVTVAVCTRNRTADLARCLDSLCCLNYPFLDILVVDNAPNNDSTERLIRTSYQNVRYICEPRPGLNWARNRAIIDAQGEIIAYTDDDVVVDPGWVSAFAGVFAENSEVMAITGLVVPYELETDAQIYFEEYGGFGRGFERKWYQISRKRNGKVARLYGIAGNFGTGANMAYRRSLFNKIGYFDPALDVGTITNGGGDLEMFFRVLKEGYMLVYEPGAIVRHCHRRDYAQLKAQIATWGVGFLSYLVCSSLNYPDERFAFIKIGVQWLWRRYLLVLLILLARPFFSRDIILVELRITEFRKLFMSLFRYQKAQRIATKIANTFGPITRAIAFEKPVSQTIAPKRSDAIAIRTIDICQPLYTVTDVLNYNYVRIFVTWNGNPLGSIDIANYCQPVGLARLRDAIIDKFTHKLLELNFGSSTNTAITQAASFHRCSPIKDKIMSTYSKLSNDISVSIVVMVRNQPNNLRNCLQCLANQKTLRQVEIIVVNNNVYSGLVASIVAEFSGVVLVNEPRRGSAYTYNKGFTTSKGTIVITIDDKVTVTGDWLEKLIAPFARNDVMVVTGNVLPEELETTAQILFERHFGLGHGFEPFEVDKNWFKSFKGSVVPIWSIGSMSNAAFRAIIFNHPQIGLINEILSAGVPTSCSGDTYLFYKVLKAGYTLVYEPSAFVWHKHYYNMSDLYRWLYHYSKSHIVCQIITLICDFDTRALRQLVIEIPKMCFRRIIKCLYGKNNYPLSFLLFEILGNLVGPFALLKSNHYVKRKGRSDVYVPISERSPIMQDSSLY